MKILLIKDMMTARRNTEAMIKVEMFARVESLIAEVEKYMNRGPVTKPTILAVIAPACSKATGVSRTLLAIIITGMLMPVLRTAKAT